MRARTVTTAISIALCLGVVALAPVSAFGANTVKYFRTPSGKVVCGWVEESLSFQNDVYCEITTGLRPPIPKRGSSCQEKDVGNEVGLKASGPAIRTACADVRWLADPYRRIGVIGYGKDLKGGGLACSEAKTGLTCRNRSGHGFFLSPQHWHTF